MHRARQGHLQRGVRPAECLLTPLPTTLSAASEQKSGRVPKPDRPHMIGYATDPDLSA